MAVNWVDRVPTRANRVLVTPENGGTPYYATVTRADEPSVVGTPVNAANLNAMQNAAGLTAHKYVYVSTTGSDTTGTGSQSAPYATINKAVSTIPANLNGYTARIYIAAGTYAENINIQNIGNGIIALTGNAGDVVTIAGSVTITNVQYMEVFNISLNVMNSYITVVGTNLSVQTLLTVSGGNYGIYANFFSNVTLTNTVTINNAAIIAVVASNCSKIYVENLIGSGNTTAISGTRGGICSFGTNAIEATNKFFTEKGGRIFSGSQTNSPVN